MTITTIVDRIQKLNEERYSKSFDAIKETGYIVSEISEGLIRHDDINETVDFNADVAVFGIGGIYKFLANTQKTGTVNVNQFINRTVKILTEDKLKDMIQQPELINENMINCKCHDTEYSIIDEAVMSVIQGIAMSTTAMIAEHKEYMTDEAILGAQVNDILTKVMRLNEIQLHLKKKPEQKFEIPIVLTTLVFGALVNLEVLGYNSVLVMDEVIKHIESRKGSLNSATGKWEKDVNQDPSTLYQPDFEKCKKVSE